MNLSWLAFPLKLAPTKLTATGLGMVLNLFFDRHPDIKERLAEMAGKRFCFEVQDLDQYFYMRVEGDGGVLVESESDDFADVTMSGDVSAFLALLFQTSDPDSLFFSRKLQLSGETDTGLQFKNLLDNVDIDWQEELTSLLGPMIGPTLYGMAETVKEKVTSGKEQVAENLGNWMDDKDIPRQDGLADWKDEVEALAEQVDAMDKRIDRLINKVKVKQAEATTKPSPAEKATTKKATTKKAPAKSTTRKKSPSAAGKTAAGKTSAGRKGNTTTKQGKESAKSGAEGDE
ncbi:MAG: SCP2 sterol-binding domain-containing protein [Magnetococcales bacterium]|nr:SCP2 sterol-binding domain-containing protein [Magnetococcales bacterium]